MIWKITQVESGSVAEEMKIPAGGELVAVNGRPMRDFADYLLAQRGQKAALVITGENGESVQYDITKAPEESLGLRFSKEDFSPRACENHCAFCMASQLPHDADETLFPRYDDWRRSVLFGEWAPLSNLTKQDFARICAQKAGPLYIALHATDPAVRGAMLGNERAGEIMPLLELLADKKVEFYASVTICPDVNDGFILRKTFEDMLVLFPYCKGLCVSPVRLTYHRRGLPRLKRVEPNTAAHILEEIARWQEKCFEMKGSHFIYATDEFYATAGMELPKKETYDGYPLFDQGVGRLSRLISEVEASLDSMPPWILDREISLICGVNLVPYLNRIIGIFQARFPNLSVHVHGIRNFFFGESIDDTKMLTGRDIAVQLDGKKLGSEVLVFNTMLPDGAHFMDGLSVEDLSNWINKPVRSVQSEGKQIACALLGINPAEA